MKTSTSTEEYDLLVLGSGTGGKILAGTFAQKGQRVIVVERKYVAGSCPNIACLPSKNIIHSAKVASFFHRSNEFGISKENVHINMAAVRERKRKMVTNIVDIFRDHYYTKTGAELVMGTGCFVGPKTIEVALNDGGTRTLRGKNVVVNTGSCATLEPIPGLAEAKPLTHIEAFELDHIPKHLLVLGAGYVGLELAQAFRRFGADIVALQNWTTTLGWISVRIGPGLGGSHGETTTDRGGREGEGGAGGRAGRPHDEPTGLGLRRPYVANRAVEKTADRGRDGTVLGRSPPRRPRPRRFGRRVVRADRSAPDGVGLVEKKSCPTRLRASGSASNRTIRS